MTRRSSPLSESGGPDALQQVVDRERDFHDRRFRSDPRAATGKYYAVDTGASAYRELLAPVAEGARVLEFGCGSGSAAFELAGRGALVTAIDISEVAIAQARANAEKQGLDIAFAVMDAHHLDLDDVSFDVVCGSGILHHLDLDVAVPEIARVLCSDGFAAFYEPLGTNPLINVYRRLTPRLRSPDEHPLLFDDLDRMGRWFGEVTWQVHTFLALAGAFLRRFGPLRAVVPWLARADRMLFRRFPWTRRLAWVVVVRLAAPREPTGRAS